MKGEWNIDLLGEVGKCPDMEELTVSRHRKAESAVIQIGTDASESTFSLIHSSVQTRTVEGKDDSLCMNSILHT